MTVVSGFTDDALGQDDTVALLARLRRREVSAQELVDAAVARGRAVEPQLNAVVAWAEEPVASAEGGMALAGIPSFVKDNEAVPGMPTRFGSRATADRPARHATPWPQQFVRLGATVLGKTTLPEFGLTSTTESLLSGPTRNPWNPGHSVGGSSGGSAALVAAGVVPLAHANDGGGSIRIPAACCGLVGLKPSRGRVVDDPELERLPVNVVVQGVVTRSVRDTAWYLAAAERRYRNRALPPIGHVTEPVARPLRIALMTQGHPSLPTSAETVAAVTRVGALCESLGHDVTPLDFPYGEQVGIDFLRYWAFLSYGITRWGGRLFGEPFDSDRLEPFTRELAGMFARAPERLPAALRRLRRFPAAYAATFAEYDVVLSPVLAHPAPPIGHLGPAADPRAHLVRLLRFVSLTPLHNIAGAPAVSLPMARSAAGLPIGIHLAAAVGQERLLLQVALQLEAASPWPAGVADG